MRQVTRKGLITVAAAGGVLALGGGYAQADSGALGEASNSPGLLSGNSVQAPVHVPVNACGNTVDVVGLLNPTFGNKCANVSESGPNGGGGSGAEGSVSNSGGIASGNQVQAPIDAPVNVCGNNVGVVGLLNPTFGNECANVSRSGTNGGGGSGAEGSVSNSPGIGSGNQVQAPINLPVNVCGNSIGVGGLLNPAFGSECVNDSGGTPPGGPEEPGTPEEPNQPEEPNEPQTPETPGTPSEPNAPGPQSVTPGGSDGELAETGMDALDILAPAGVGLLLAGAVLYRRARAAA
ncbi:chaplin [Streptomyces sp. NPDC086835]|jgi:hypothetical protein|uniref:chaplin n=1 Tax=Streptomyces sp. NPDC086835 TaxID=3365761 RepID=UPI0038177E04